MERKRRFLHETAPVREYTTYQSASPTHSHDDRTPRVRDDGTDDYKPPPPPGTDAPPPPPRSDDDDPDTFGDW